MGCAQSKRSRGATNGHGGNAEPKDDFQPSKSNPLSKREIEQRIDAAKEFHTMAIDGLNMRYAWVSQRGYYPECTSFCVSVFCAICKIGVDLSPVITLLFFNPLAALNKENQDAYLILPTLGNVQDQAFFGVFDGHGKDGHHCSRYARDHVRFKTLSFLYM